jgi:hypothetical protein
MYSIGVTIYDLHLVLKLPSQAIAEQVLALLPPNAKVGALESGHAEFRLEKLAGTPGKTRFVVSDHASFTESCHSLSYARDLLKTRIELYLAENCSAFAFVHAGVVRFGNITIIIPGVSCSGKTPLVAKLLTAGGSYLSDEYALLDRHGMVHPFSRSLAIRTASTKQYVRPNTLGQIETEKHTVNLVLLTRFIAGAVWRPRPISPARAALEIFQNTLPAIERPSWALRAIRAAVENAHCVRGSRGDASQIITWLNQSTLNGVHA